MFNSNRNENDAEHSWHMALMSAMKKSIKKRALLKKAPHKSGILPNN
ncbi:HD domain-containing protein [Fluviicola taffensis]